MKQCIEVIHNKLPAVFILENVKNFKYYANGQAFNYLIEQLENINEYNIYYEILNTKDYGIPQNRERIFIIGIKRDIQIEEFAKPQTLPLLPFDNIILDKTVHTGNVPPTILKKLTKFNVVNSNYICPCDGFTKGMYDLSPTLTTNSKSMYHSTYNRFLTPKESLLLQGFPETFEQVVSNTQMYKQAGNSMSVNVLKALFAKIIEITLFRYYV